MYKVINKGDSILEIPVYDIQTCCKFSSTIDHMSQRRNKVMFCGHAKYYGW